MTLFLAWVNIFSGECTDGKFCSDRLLELVYAFFDYFTLPFLLLFMKDIALVVFFVVLCERDYKQRM